MNNKMLVSIITVCYNAENTIETTIKSVLNQTYNNVEYIIIDGGSTDDTLDIIKNYEDEFNDKIKLVSESDNGVYDAMNKGIKKADGQIIGIINADDWYEEKAVEKVIKASQQAEDDSFIITGGVYKCELSGKKLFYLDKGKEVSENIKKEMPVNHPSTFVSKLVYEKIGLFNTKYRIAADYDFIYRAFNANIPIFFIDENLSYMTIGGLSSGLKNKNKVIHEKLLIQINNGSKTYAFLNYLRNIFIYFARRIKRILFI